MRDTELERLSFITREGGARLHALEVDVFEDGHLLDQQEGAVRAACPSARARVS